MNPDNTTCLGYHFSCRFITKFSKKNDEVAAVSGQTKWAEIYRNQGDRLTFRAIRVYIITY